MVWRVFSKKCGGSHLVYSLIKDYIIPKSGDNYVAKSEHRGIYQIS
jgi:hypothetical protein